MKLDWTFYYRQLNKVRLGLLLLIVTPIIFGIAETLISSGNIKRILETFFFCSYIGFLLLFFLPNLKRLNQVKCPNCGKAIHRIGLNYPLLSKSCTNCDVKIGAEEPISRG